MRDTRLALEMVPPRGTRWDPVLVSMVGIAGLVHVVAIFAWLVLRMSGPTPETPPRPGTVLQAVALVEAPLPATAPPRPQPAVPRRAPGRPQAGASAPRPAAPVRRHPMAAARSAVAAPLTPFPLRHPTAAAPVPDRPGPTRSVPSGRAIAAKARATASTTPQSGTAPGGSSGPSGPTAFAPPGSGSGGRPGSGGSAPGGAEGLGDDSGGGSTAGVPAPHVHATAWYPTEGLDWHGGTLRLQGREPRTWSELCDRIGISIVDLDGRPRVGPFMIGFGFGDADRSELSRLEGQHGRVVVRVHVAFDGSPTVQIAASSGSPLLDRTAAAMVSRSHWLPALREGQAVDDEVEFPVTFDDGNATGLVMEGLPAGR